MKLIADKYWTRIDNEGVGHLMIETEGETLEVDIIKDIEGLGADELHKKVDFLLKFNDIEIKPEQPKAKRPYHRRTTLGLAKDFGKITLNIAEPEKKIGYILYLKGTNKYVYRFDKRGIYVMEENDKRKTKPIIWSPEDIKCIRNSSEFDFKKVEVRSRPKNRLA